MFLVARTPRKTVGPVSRRIGGHKRTSGEAGIALPVSARGVSVVSGIRLDLHWKLRTLDAIWSRFHEALRLTKAGLSD